MGPEHPSALAVGNLATAAPTDAGPLREAEPPLNRASPAHEPALGPTTLMSLDAQQPGLAVQNQGRYAEAEPLYRRALAIRREGAGA